MSIDQMWNKPIAGMLFGIILGVVAGVFIVNTPTVVCTKGATVPPGFVLVTNQLGQWRAAYADTFVILTPFKRAADGTRKQAIRRAQVQYEFDCERDKALWIKAE